MFLTFLRVWLGSIHFERITRYASSGGGGSTTERGFAYYQWIRAQSASPPLSLAGSGSDRSACLATSQRRAFKTRGRSEEHTSELQSLTNLVCRLLLEKNNPQLSAHS